MAHTLETIKGDYSKALLDGDLERASELIGMAQLSGIGPLSLAINLLSPALAEIGELWHQGKINIALEHLATQFTVQVLDELRARERLNPKNGKRCVVTAVEGEDHAVGVHVIANALYHDGWDVDYLGANTPTKDLVDFVRQRGASMVVLSVTLTENVQHALKALQEIKALADAPKVMLGGYAVSLEPDTFAEADATVSDPNQALIEARRLSGLDQGVCLDRQLTQLGTKVQELRHQKGWNQKELADAAELDRTYVSAVERGKQNLSLGVLVRIANALDTQLETLMAFDSSR